MTSRSRLVLIVAAFCLVGAASAAPASAALSAWSPVATSGPTNLPPLQSEVQRLGIDAEGGTFTLTAHHVAARGTGEVQLNLISNVATASGAFAVGQGIEGIGIPPGTTITAINPTGPNTLELSKEGPSNAPAASLIATDAGAETTPPIAYNASASEIEAALNSLGLINTGGGNVSVSGGPGGPDAAHPYFVSFGGSLANADAAQLTTDASTLTGSGRSATALTAVPGGPGTGKIAIYFQNVGGIPSSGTLTASVTLPPGVITSAIPKGPGTVSAWSCSPAGSQSFTCTSTRAVGSGSASEAILAPVVTDPTAAGTKPVQITVSGGGATKPASYSMPLTVSAIPALPGIQSFTAGAYDGNGVPDIRAGGHSYSVSAGILINL